MTKNIFTIIAIFLLVWGASGCCPSSKVILLDSGKAENAIIVKTKNGDLILDKPNTYTDISSVKQVPSVSGTISSQELEKKYGNLIHSAPKPPEKILLYFTPDSTILTEKSKKLFPFIDKTIHSRIPCNISIIGHTDRVGSKEYNIRLSLKRARWVYEWLQQKESMTENITIESYGEEDPLIPTADGVAEPKNRRVEILIR